MAHTIAVAGMSLLLQSNGSNFGSMFVILDPFDQRRRNPSCSADAIMAGCAQNTSHEIPEAG